MNSMPHNLFRRLVMTCIACFWPLSAENCLADEHAQSVRLPGNRRLGSILNNDTNNILNASSGEKITAGEYKKAVLHLLDARPGVLAQNVGMPDPVIYRSKVATTWDKYHAQVVKDVFGAKNDRQASAMRKLLELGTDPLKITIEACRARDVLIVASYRMNAEDFGRGELDLYDFGRRNKGLQIPDCNCLDPAHPKVFQHRMAIFSEVANAYDIDGIEFDFKRSNHMVSHPHKNYPVLTRMVTETRQMLDEVAERKGRDRLLLGVRVSHIIAGRPSHGSDLNCRDLGLDIKTWIEKGYVDYVCPSYFWPHWPGLPNTKEFVKLAQGTDVGIYPTLFPLPDWLAGGKPIEPDDRHRLLRYKNEFCTLALKCYDDGADGISTFNWVPHHQPGMIAHPRRQAWGLGAKKVQMRVHSRLASPQALREYLKRENPLIE